MKTRKKTKRPKHHAPGVYSVFKHEQPPEYVQILGHKHDTDRCGKWAVYQLVDWGRAETYRLAENEAGRCFESIITYKEGR